MSIKEQENEVQRGILFVTSTPTLVTQEIWNKWYDEKHIPDIFATSGIATAYRYDNKTPSTILASPAPTQEFLAMYPVRDIAWLGSEEYRSIPIKSTVLGGSGEGEEERLCFSVADLEAWYYAWSDGFEGENSKNHPAPGKLIITAALTPPSDQEDEFNNWYKHEHFEMLAKCKGYLRSRRYRIHKTMSMKGKQAPTFLAIHEFEDGELDAQGLVAATATEWGKKVMGGLVESQMDVWRMRGDGVGKLEVEF